MDCPRCKDDVTFQTSIEKDYWLCTKCCLILPKNSTWVRSVITTSQKATALASFFALGLALGTLDTYTLVSAFTVTSIITAIIHSKYYPAWANKPHLNGDEKKPAMFYQHIHSTMRNKLFADILSLRFQRLERLSLTGFIKNHRHYPGSYSEVCLAYCLAITRCELFTHKEQTKVILEEHFMKELSILSTATIDSKTGMFKIKPQDQDQDQDFIHAVTSYNIKSPKSSQKKEQLIELFKQNMPFGSSIIMALEDVLHVVVYKFFNKQENNTGYWVYIPLYNISTAYLNQPDYLYPIQPGFINALMELTGVEADSIKLYLPYRYTQ